MLILHNFFLKYEVGLKLTPPLNSEKKLPSKSPALLGLIGFVFFKC